MSNYSPLMRNTLDGLSEPAGCLYLTLLDKFQGHNSRDGERQAFLAACDFDRKAGATLDYILRRNPVHNIDPETRRSLSQFFAERWRYNFMARAA